MFQRWHDLLFAPWPLRPAEAAFQEETVTTAAGFALEGPPRLAFADRLDVHVWSLQRLG